jgi:hypothetical protein
MELWGSIEKKNLELRKSGTICCNLFPQPQNTQNDTEVYKFVSLRTPTSAVRYLSLNTYLKWQFKYVLIASAHIISLADKSVPLHTDVSALPFEEYLGKIAG